MSVSSRSSWYLVGCQSQSKGSLREKNQANGLWDSRTLNTNMNIRTVILCIWVIMESTTVRTRGDLRNGLVWPPHFAAGVPCAQAGSALARAGHDLREMGTVQVFSLLASLFFVGFREPSFLSSHNYILDSMGFNGVETTPPTIENVLSGIQFWKLRWMYSGPDWIKESPPKKILCLVLNVSLWFFLSKGEIQGNWGEGNPLTAQHLSILDVTLGNYRPISVPPDPGLSERGRALSRSHSEFVAGLTNLKGAEISQLQVQALFPTLSVSTSVQTGGKDFPPGKLWGGPLLTLGTGLQGSDVCEDLTGQFIVECSTRRDR